VIGINRYSMYNVTLEVIRRHNIKLWHHLLTKDYFMGTRYRRSCVPLVSGTKVQMHNEIISWETWQ
jgi:hypothetical protein